MAAKSTSRPIRVGIIGLSVKPSAWATLAHFPGLNASPNYQIVAVCNSTLESTQAAIKHFNLPSTTKAYSTYESLAQDPDVDLYVVSTRADTHYECALPALAASRQGKSIYVEWPLASSAAQAHEMLDLSRKSGVHTIVGFQGRAAPATQKIKSLIDSGRLGDIHSVNYQGWTNVWQNNAVSERYSYFRDRKVGGNLCTIYAGHILDSLLYACGELVPGSEKVVSGNLRKQIAVEHLDGTVTSETYPKDTPDQMALIGRLDRSPVQPLFSMHLRAGARFIDGPGCQIRIYGTKAELLVEFASATVQIGPATRFQLSDFEKNVIEDIVVDEGGEKWTNLPVPGQNIGRLYEMFAENKDYADWEVAVKRHELIEQFFDSMY